MLEFIYLFIYQTPIVLFVIGNEFSIFMIYCIRNAHCAATARLLINEG